MKLLFDENFGRPMVEALKQVVAFSRDPVEVRHIIELRHGGRGDNEWVPEVAGNDWLVLTCDRGKRAGPKLPQLCREAGLTHVLISGSLHNSPQFEKARAVLVVWPALVEAASATAGTRFSLRYSHSRHPSLVKTDTSA
jgi:hypothetical protein